MARAPQSPEFRNKLFSLFTFNRYTFKFVMDDLLAGPWSDPIRVSRTPGRRCTDKTRSPDISFCIPYRIEPSILRRGRDGYPAGQMPPAHTSPACRCD